MEKVEKGTAWEYVGLDDSGKEVYFVAKPLGQEKYRKKEKVKYPTFSGKRDEHVLKWVNQMYYSASIEGLTEKELFNRIKRQLRGDARDWAMYLDDDTLENMAAFARAVQKEFGLPDSRFLEVELRQMRQEEGETAREFIRRVRGIGCVIPNAPMPSSAVYCREKLGNPSYW